MLAVPLAPHRGSKKDATGIGRRLLGLQAGIKIPFEAEQILS